MAAIAPVSTSAPSAIKFRPCIDIHKGKVKQIVGSSLKDLSGDSSADGAALKTNFESDKPSSHFSEMYARDGLKGGHVIMLGADDASRATALLALRSYPGGLHMGGGITTANAMKYLDAGASHVIVTSYVFRDGALDEGRLADLVKLVGKERLVLDLSCRSRDGTYYVVTDRWQRFSDLALSEATLATLAQSCDEFLVHGVDVEGMQLGIDDKLVELLGKWSPIPVTYAGGARTLEDLERVNSCGAGRVDITVGSALDIFGGKLPYTDVCLARWQLQSAGQAEEYQCRFCNEALPDYRDTLAHGGAAKPTHGGASSQLSDAPLPSLRVTHGSKTCVVQLGPGQEGCERFEREVKQILGLPAGEKLHVNFNLRAPPGASSSAGQPTDVNLSGLGTYDAAFWVASQTAAARAAEASTGGAGQAVPTVSVTAVPPAAAPSQPQLPPPPPPHTLAPGTRVKGVRVVHHSADGCPLPDILQGTVHSLPQFHLHHPGGFVPGPLHTHPPARAHVARPAPAAAAAAPTPEARGLLSAPPHSDGGVHLLQTARTHSLPRFDFHLGGSGTPPSGRACTARQAPAVAAAAPQKVNSAAPRPEARSLLSTPARSDSDVGGYRRLLSAEGARNASPLRLTMMERVALLFSTRKY
ncbi:hypothetical protein FOA52_011578 [Chlamydomonas sp. UWO 241]|nr:hypothetical protein FOA52_011578 [Chlamydomonas sp. UWO 241]